MTAYWTLITKETDCLWYAQFGDYDREVVLQEMRDEYAGRICRVIKTGDTQASINARITDINAGRA